MHSATSLAWPAARPSGWVHIGNQGDNFLAHAYAGFDHSLARVHRFFFALHERAEPTLTSRTRAVDAFGEFSCS